MQTAVRSHGVAKEELYEGACNKIFKENGTLQQAFMSLSVIIRQRTETASSTAACSEVSWALFTAFVYCEVSLVRVAVVFKRLRQLATLTMHVALQVMSLETSSAMVHVEYIYPYVGA
jgi:hypothetical protein